jgi:hypothetical protein
MRKPIILLGLLLISVCLVLHGCGNGNDACELDFTGSDNMVKEVRVGATTVTAGGTFNIPFEYVDTLTFELNGKVNPVTFTQFLTVRIVVTNLDRCGSIVLTTCYMQENGYFTIYNDGQTVEYRMYHAIDRVWSGGTPIEPPLWYPGDTLEVYVEYVVGKDVKGHWFAFKEDRFNLVYVSAIY